MPSNTADFNERAIAQSLLVRDDVRTVAAFLYKISKRPSDEHIPNTTVFVAAALLDNEINLQMLSGLIETFQTKKVL